MNQKIINLCPTGTQSTKDNSLAPIFITEIIDDVLACHEIGITLVHLHARDSSGQNTYKKEVFQQIIEGITKYAPDLLIGVSLSGRFFTDKSLRTEVLSLHPDFGSLTMSSLNFPQTASINAPETILWLIEEMNHYGVQPEVECFDSGMLNYTNYLLHKGILKQPVYINVILGNLFNAAADLLSTATILNQVPKDAFVCLGGIGKAQLKANVMGLLEASGVRVGLEDNFYWEDKTKATNLGLVKRIHRMIHEFGQEYMTSTSFKKLGYGNQTISRLG
ncbi:MAG: 3-keto-5-aminohexanoate cleavage protein [Flectobacillus sp.]|nr:3-keto-5-aminohexanoate cleavage protein [Flectobacillus sp.]